MRDLLGEVRTRLQGQLRAALASAIAAGDLPGDALSVGAGDRGLPPFTVEPPKEKEHGDFATNLALVLAGRLKRSPRQVAEAVARHFPTCHFPAAADQGDRDPGGVVVERLEVAGPGFINLTLKPGWLAAVVPLVNELGPAYGRTGHGQGMKVLVEFVSANPTGPLNVVNARAAAFGDSLANVLAAAGYDVSREYYVNDAGNQFGKLALAMEIRCRQALGQGIELPEGAYPGEYVADLAREFLEGVDGHAARQVLQAHPEPGGSARELAALREGLGRFAVERIVAGQQGVLARYGVRYDTWYRESAVRESGGPERALGILTDNGYTYKKDGAIWFQSTSFGDDQDRVLVRSSGEYTYFLADIAYHLTKFERGFSRLIDIWGQDHHGYVPRMQAALQALGYPASLEVLLNQMVRLVRDGQTVKMSKRAGEFVTMEEFLSDVGTDAARFMFLMRSIDSHMDFDIDLARLQASENPVYYVQYAHARICSILRQAEERRGDADGDGMQPADGKQKGTRTLGELLVEEAERDLMMKMAAFPGEVSDAAERREPHRLTVYAQELATLFHAFYTRCRVLGDDPDLTAARLMLVAAARQVLFNTLSLLGVSAPERM